MEFTEIKEDGQGTPKSKASSPSRRTTFQAVQQPDPKVQELLNLLPIFVQLKESAGVEHAILSSLLALQLGNDKSIGLLMNDLILEVKNQRSLVAKMEQLSVGLHHNLVLELGQMSPHLNELQIIILHDFESLQTAKYDSETIWNMITLYVDKLHSVEVLIIEELECSLPMPMPSPSSMVITISSAASQQTTSQLQTTATATQALSRLSPPPKISWP